jgi:hypothetical protein
VIKKVLAIPNISTTTDVWCEGDFITFYQLAKVWQDVDVYIPLYHKAIVPVEYRLPNLHVVEVRSWIPYVQSQCLISSEIFGLFNPINGRYQVDAVVTSKTQAAPYLKRLMNIGESVFIPVFVIEPWANHQVSEADEKIKAVSYSECPTFYYLDRERDICLSKVKKYLAPSEVLKAQKLAIVQPTGVGAKFVQLVAQRVEKFPKFTFCYAARFNAQKNWEKALTLMYEACPVSNGRVLAITPNDYSDMPKHLRGVELSKPLPYNEYIETLCRSHVSVCTSVNEGYSFGWTEQVCTGNPIFFPDKEWVHSLVPGYPLIYENFQQLKSMLISVQRKYEEVRNHIADYVGKFVEKNDYSYCAGQILARMDKGMEKSFMPYVGWDSKWSSVLDGMDGEFHFDKFIQEAARTYKATFGNPLMFISSYRNIYKWLIDHCEVVKCKEMVFRKASK